MTPVPETHQSANRARRLLALLALVIAAAILPCLSTLGYGFVYDDHLAIEENPHLRVWPGLSRIFFSDIWNLSGLSSESNYYRPMFLLAYAGVFHAAGPAPWAFHLLNLLFHTAATVMVFVLALRLWKSDSVALVASLLFALHPAHVEAVAWVAALSEMAYSFFVLLGLYFYISEKPTRASTAAWIASFGMACLWKESAIAFLPLMILYDAVALRQIRWRRWAALTGVAGFYLALRTVALGGLAPAVLYPHLSVATQVLTAISNVGFYLRKLAIPTNLSAFYEPEFVNQVNANIAIVVALALLATWWLREKMAWSALWIAGTLLPVLAVSRIAVPLADRDLYLPSVGFVWLVAVLLNRLGRNGVVALMTMAMIAYGALTLRRVPDWRDDLPLFEQALRQTPQSRTVRLLLASELGRRGRHTEAIAHLEEALKHDPHDLEALIGKAGLQVSQRDWAGVRATCAAALAIDAGSARCLLDLGYADEHEGKLPEAREKFRRAFQRDPRLWPALLHQGLVDARLGNLSAAAEALELAVQHNPTAPALNNLGSIYAERGEFQKAVRAFRDALRVDPSFELANRNLERALADSR
jgi:tetratricopeptide (TPR) repeat protein